MDDYDRGGYTKYCIILIAAYPHPIKGCGFATGVLQRRNWRALEKKGGKKYEYI